MTICCVVVPSERLPLSSGSGSTNFATVLPESGVCGVVTDAELSGVTSSAALSQPAPALMANAAAAIAVAEIEKLARLMIDSPSATENGATGTALSVVGVRFDQA